MKNSLKFITWPAIAGLLTALLILDRQLPRSAAPKGLTPAPTSYAQAVHQASPSVVNIYTAKLIPAKRQQPSEGEDQQQGSPSPLLRPQVERSLGSGVIMTDQGHILTNNHVIAEADAIQILLHDGRSANATVVGTDPATDLAVLHIDLPNLQPIQRVDSDTARVGDVVLAIGNPLGFGHSVTQGIVSALGRYGLQLSTYEDYIQTDATIHLGNSGGALIDSQGRLLGINTLFYTATQAPSTPSGISLAIPANLALFVMQDIIDYGKVIRGWLGVSVEPIAPANKTRYPLKQVLVVIAVTRGSPAHRAGIQLGDIITHINGDLVVDGRLTMHRIALLRPGDTIAVTVQRRQQRVDLHAIVGTLPASRGTANSRTGG